MGGKHQHMGISLINDGWFMVDDYLGLYHSFQIYPIYWGLAQSMNGESHAQPTSI